MGSKIIKLILGLVILPSLMYAQGIGFRKTDTALVASDAGQYRVFKSQPYYSTQLGLKIRYADTTTKIVTRTYGAANYVKLTGNETIAGIKTFSSVVRGITPSGNTDLTTKLYVDGQTGWAQYTDNVITSGSPLVVNAGATANITNNAATVINAQLPTGITSLWNSSTSKVTPQLDGDSYLIDVRFIATSNNASGLIDVSIDIGAPMNVIVKKSVLLSKGVGITQNVDVIFDVFSGAIFVANGGLIKLSSITGNTTIYDISFKITRVHKAR